MDDDSRFGSVVKLGLGALGLGALGVVVMDPHYGILIAVALVVLVLLFLAAFLLWRRMQARRRRRQFESFSSAIEAQTSKAPASVSDPRSRAELDQLRQKFQKGLQEFKSRGKGVYKLPWYVIIGESGSGKTEALRHSGIEFPPGLQDEFQGAGGTVNMDWWFTNRAVILDTAGKMVLPETRSSETPEWREFLRLLKRNRPQCPINGLFVVLSIESLIKDSADAIASKANRLAQQLDLIQRTLDVRFPVYLLVTKCDLLTGFREFFDNIEDPLLQHQMFGWSNPSPLDEHFRPDLVEQHLQSVAERLRRRRLALLLDRPAGGRSTDTSHFYASPYEAGKGTAPARRLDAMDAMFALPESIMRLAPRLRRYLETIFVAGEWSAKPVFLRGIYFTTSMREGKALDEAISLATGLPLDQLPDDRSWEKNRAFFLRDLFHEKVFRESGLVTRATNTLKLVRGRQLAIFGAMALALLVLLGFAFYGGSKLRNSVGREAADWRAATNGWSGNIWTNGCIVVEDDKKPLQFAYAATNRVPDTAFTVAGFHQHLQAEVARSLSGGGIFKPLSWVGIIPNIDKDRREAQRCLFEGGVLNPLVLFTRSKMTSPKHLADLERHPTAWISLLQLQVDGTYPDGLRSFISSRSAAERNLNAWLDYLTEENVRLDSNLVDVFMDDYAGGKGTWPPKKLLKSGGETLDGNLALKEGIEKFGAAGIKAQSNLTGQLTILNQAAAAMTAYSGKETAWLQRPPADPCAALANELQPLKTAADTAWLNLRETTNPVPPASDFRSFYDRLATFASSTSTSVLQDPVTRIKNSIPKQSQLLIEVQRRVDELGSGAAAPVNKARQANSDLNFLDVNYMVSTNDVPAYQTRWELFSNACSFASRKIKLKDADLGQGLRQYSEIKKSVAEYQAKLATYNGPLALETANACNNLAREAARDLTAQFVDGYRRLAQSDLDYYASLTNWNADAVSNAQTLFTHLESDLNSSNGPVISAGIGSAIEDRKTSVLQGINAYIVNRLGFPVRLDDSATRMQPQELSNLVGLFNSLTTSLQSPEWENDNSGTLKKLKSTCDLYQQRISLLTNEWEVLFVLPGTRKNREIVKVFQKVVLTTSQGAKPFDNLSEMDSETPTPLVKCPGTSEVTLTFNKDYLDKGPGQTPVNFQSWGIFELIHKNPAGRRPAGEGWRVEIPLTDSRQHLSGNVVLELRPVNRTKLPTYDEWSK